MILVELKKRAFKGLVIILIASQFALAGILMTTPKPAQAFWGVGDFNFSTVVANWAEVLVRIAEGALMRIAQQYANKYLTRFVQKVTDKYKIRDILYYDKYLSDYYLSNLIMKNISDPDLKEAFDLMYRATVSGRTGGYTGVGTDPRKALIPKLKQAMAKVYINQGGIDPNNIYYPAAGVSDREYFASAQAYFSNPPSFTEQNIQGQFGAFQSEATTASQLEITIGNGLKAGRIIGGTCKMAAAQQGPALDGSSIGSSVSTSGIKDPVACAAAGGTWNASLLDQARSFIDNPTATVSHLTESALNKIFDNNYDANNIWTAVGSALGNFVFNQLNLDDSDGTFDEGVGDRFAGGSGSVPPVAELDLDNDSIPEGEDVDDNGLLTGISDTCYHGGVANDEHGCALSTQVGASPYFAPFCQSIDQAVIALTTFADFMSAHADQMEGGASLSGQIIGGVLTGGLLGVIGGGFLGSGSIDNFKNQADADIWSRRAQDASTMIDNMIRTVQNFHNPKYDNTEIALGRYSSYITKVVDSLIKDKDLDLAKGGSGGGGLENLMKNTANILKYIRDVKAVLGKCANPDSDAINQVPVPVIDLGAQTDQPACTLTLDINSSVTVPTDPDPTAPGSGTGSSSGNATVTCPNVSPEDFLPTQ